MVDFRRALDNQRAGRPPFPTHGTSGKAAAARGGSSWGSARESTTEARAIDWSATELRGVLDRIIWPKPAPDAAPSRDGMVIARLRDGSSVKGVIFSPVIGQEYIFSPGRWEEGRRRDDGRQFDPTFVFKDALALAPTTGAGVRDYLRAHCPNVGPAVARAIVEAFGDLDALTICKTDPARVAAAVRGITPARAEEIKVQLLARASIEAVEVDVRGIVADVPPPGITTRQLRAILAEYGAKSAEVLRREPYRLIEEIAGVGWKTADAIGAGVGIASDDPERLRAGVLHAIASAEDEGGHTCVEAGSLLVAAVGLLLVDMGVVERRIGELKGSGELVEHAGASGAPTIARAPMFDAESAISAAFVRLLGPEKIVVRRPVEAKAPTLDEADALAVEYEARAASAEAHVARKAAAASVPAGAATASTSASSIRAGRRDAATPLEAWTGAALRALAAMDGDHAQERNGAGFSKSDGPRGHRWAKAVGDPGAGDGPGSGPGLTDAEWAAAVCLACKYRRQVGAPPSAGAEPASEEARMT